MKKLLFILLSVIPINSFSQEKIPFRYDRHIYIDALINGEKPASLVFDTGADYLYLDTLFFQESGLNCTAVAKGNVPGIGAGAQKVDICVDPYEFNFGDQNPSSKITPLIDLKNLLGRKADGLFGTIFLNEKVLLFNYQDKYMQLADPGVFELNGFEKIPAVIRKNRVFFNATAILLSGKEITGEYMLDMGAPMAIYFSGKTTKSHSLKSPGVPTMEHYTNRGGIGGKSSGAHFRIKTIKVGSQSINMPIANCYYDDEGALGSSTSYLGLIGNGFFNKFILMIDFPNSCIYLKPNPNNDKDEFNGVGFTWIDRTDINKGWIVRKMYRQSPGEKAGLLLEDEIIKINGLDVGSLSEKKGKEILSDSGALVDLTILRNDRQLSIKYTPGLEEEFK